MHSVIMDIANGAQVANIVPTGSTEHVDPATLKNIRPRNVKNSLMNRSIVQHIFALLTMIVVKINSVLKEDAPRAMSANFVQTESTEHVDPAFRPKTPPAQVGVHVDQKLVSALLIMIVLDRPSVEMDYAPRANTANIALTDMTEHVDHVDILPKKKTEMDMTSTVQPSST